MTAGDNASYIAACAGVIEDARATVREQSHGLGEGHVWIPGYDLDCFDLARADAQLRERFPGRTQPR